jgi:hypothetical protein
MSAPAFCSLPCQGAGQLARISPSGRGQHNRPTLSRFRLLAKERGPRKQFSRITLRSQKRGERRVRYTDYFIKVDSTKSGSLAPRRRRGRQAKRIRFAKERRRRRNGSRSKNKEGDTHGKGLDRGPQRNSPLHCRGKSQEHRTGVENRANSVPREGCYGEIPYRP